MFICKYIRWFAFAVFFGATSLFAQQQAVVVGNVRAQLLSDSLVRLEVKGPQGFEDRKTFHVVNRDWQGAQFSTQTNSDAVEIRAHDFYVRVPLNATSLDGVTVLSANGDVLYRYDGHLENNRWLPAPSDHPQVWWFADTPRIVPPTWGLTPPPLMKMKHLVSIKDDGWDLTNNAPDVYVFVPHGEYKQLRSIFLSSPGRARCRRSMPSARGTVAGMITARPRH